MCRYQQDGRDLEEAPSSSPRLVAVCVDSSKNSMSAFKWAVEEALAGNSQPQPIVLVHVKQPAQPHVREILLPFRVFCARKGVFCMDAVLDDGHGDVARSIVEFASRGVVERLVVGATARGLFRRRFMAADDIPTAVYKGAPDFCEVYVIGEAGKVSSVRASTDRAPSASPLWPEIRRLAEAAASPPAGRNRLGRRYGGSVSMPDSILQENQELRRANETLAQRHEVHTRMILMLFAELGKEPPRELLHNIQTPSDMNGRQEPVTFNTLFHEQDIHVT
ncbi:hypothetical protein CFC21_101547 [Triticum aestivum]|uniref:RING-type E3 ubiquitin transferase n=2 Tax=Triticum aestivum TaxID=4565 RepID=A0A9R1N469_WHEAT|nr:U-box domain-containing protein 52-like isoform X1 [Triticum aestivum]KAF7099972.1 hypothetical protein CFC21_101546 [Triticum aestivum]KAF7099974.1 hypothetical protein CFC21_101547 [Triticum aestivum]